MKPLQQNQAIITSISIEYLLWYLYQCWHKGTYYLWYYKILLEQNFI